MLECPGIKSLGASRLVNLGDITQPKVPQKRPEADRSFTYVDIGSVDRERKVIVELQTIMGEQAPSRARQVLAAGDVLVSMTRPNLNAVAIVPDDLSKPIGSTGFHVLRARREVVEPRYLYYLAQSPAFVQSLCGVVQGALYPAVRPKDVTDYKFHLPVSLLDQQAIVTRLDEQFSQLDAGVAALKRAQANLKRYRASVLKAACEGRLVPTEAELAQQEGRDYETGDQLLTRILDERRRSWSGKGIYREPKAIDTTHLGCVPQGWTWAAFEQVSRRVTVGFVGSMKHEYVANGVPFLRSQNVRENRFDPRGLLFVSPTFHAKLSKSAIRGGDIAVVRSGSVGVSCVIPDSVTEANCADLVLIQQPFIIPRYGAYYMNSLARRHIEAGKVGVALTHFNTQSVAALPIPLPPLAEQERIVAEVERRLSVADQLEATLTASLHRASRLRQSILQAAFSGGQSHA